MRAAALLLLLMMGPTLAQTPYPHVDSPRWTRVYDPLFRKYSKQYFGVLHDWRWFKAQAIAESTLDPKARSHVGAVGLMQIMPTTFAEIRRSEPSYRNIHDVRWNIAAAIYYDRYLYRQEAWESFAERDRLIASFAAYNVGLGGALRAYKRAAPPVTAWHKMAPYVPKETQGYVRRISTIMNGGVAPETRSVADSKPPPRQPFRRGIAAKVLKHRPTTHAE